MNICLSDYSYSDYFNRIYMRFMQFELRNFEYISQKWVIVIFTEYMWLHQQTLKGTPIKVQKASYFSLPTPYVIIMCLPNSCHNAQLSKFLNCRKYQHKTTSEWGFIMLKIVFGWGLCPMDPLQGLCPWPTGGLKRPRLLSNFLSLKKNYSIHFTECLATPRQI